MLRPELYRRLRDCFRGHVTIANENQTMVAATHRRDGRAELVVADGGEYYRVDCPFCQDTRRRLWINYLWGKWDESTQSRNLFLAVCYNEGCLAKQGHAKVLYDRVYSDFIFEADELRDGVPATASLSTVEWPGRMVLVNELDYKHPARRYLEEERKYDVDILSKTFDVRFMLEPDEKYRMTYQRLIIPAYREGALMGWQARFVGTPPHKTIPKYYSAPGMKRNQILYNFDNAKKHDFVVVMEGPTDVWSFGPEAVALFGKSLSTAQTQMLLGTWNTIYICLDGDALIDAQGIYDQLGTQARCKRLVKLPDRLDPGDLPTVKLRDYVFSAV